MIIVFNGTRRQGDSDDDNGYEWLITMMCYLRFLKFDWLVNYEDERTEVNRPLIWSVLFLLA